MKRRILIRVLSLTVFTAVAGGLGPHPGYPQTGANLITAVEDVAQTVGPAVVSIRTEQMTRIQRNPRYYGNPYYEDFYSRFFEEFFGGYPDYEQKRSGLGSGVIIAPDGYILTNEHVLRGADKITVTLSDRRSFTAEIKGTDPRSDLAVIKINAPDLPVAPLGNSDDLKIGQWVVAIGNPFGHVLDDPEPTVTSGVISALHRALPVTSRSDTDYSDLIQTDAAINPGNSGGPLVNLTGEIVGINVAIFTTSGGYQGIGFAVPINYAKAIVEHLTKGRKLAFGWIGVGIQDLDGRLVQYFGLKSADGVLVNRVLEGGTAQKAGVQEGDIILSVNGLRVRNTTSLIKYITNADIGETVKLAIIRDRREITVPVLIAKRPALGMTAQAPSEEPPPGTTAPRWRGLEVGDIPEELLSSLPPGEDQGVFVEDIEENSAAQEAGLREGDIIITINKQRVGSVRDFNRITRSIGGSCLVRTLRGHFVIEDHGQQ